MNSFNVNGKSLVDREITLQLFNPRRDIGSSYGMGWEIREWKGYQRFKHDGLTQSFSSSMLILPELDLGIIIMANINNSPLTIELADGILRIITDKERVEYSKTGFYFRNSLPIFAAWILIVLFFRIKKWKKSNFRVGVTRKIIPNLWLMLGTGFGLFWVIYFPVAYNTPLFAIIDYEPNSGISLVILTTGIILNSLIGYFIRSTSFPKKRAPEPT
jgi:hypothetical protein